MMWPGILKLPFLFGGTRNSLYYPVYATNGSEPRHQLFVIFMGRAGREVGVLQRGYRFGGLC